MNEQIDLFAASYEKPELPKHIKLIEFFAGIGAQAKSLEILGADFEHWRTCEWSWQSITAYNAIHMGGKVEDTSNLTYEEVLQRINGVSADYNKPMTETELRRKGETWARNLLGRMIANHNVCPNISQLKGKDLGIVERESNTYILTYSFPCQDLSNAGLMQGMEKGSGTRSGLLWEVERILLECKELDSLPQVLLMENVPGVHSQANEKPWQDWLMSLSRMGYTNYWKDMNAKDYGIPQNRKRTFMISLLGDCSFHFPKKQPLKYVLKDFIYKKVDESYYLPNDLVKEFERYVEKEGNQGENPLRDLEGLHGSPRRGWSDSLLEGRTRCCSEGGNTYSAHPSVVTNGGGNHEIKVVLWGGIGEKTSNGGTQWYEQNRIYGSEGLDTAIPAESSFHPYYTSKETGMKKLRIRKLTEGECYRLMGFEEKDSEACKKAGQSKANIYHQAGDSIVTTCLVGIFGELLGLDYDKAISDYADRLHGETL